MRIRTSLYPLALTAAATLLLGACAQLPKDQAAAKTAAVSGPAATATRPAIAASAPTATPTATATSPGTPVARPPSTPPGPPPFATVIKDASRIDGPLVLWQKDDKVWIELLPSQLGQPFLLSPKIKSGISEAWVLGGLMGTSVNGAGGVQLVEFVRVHNQVRLQARNSEVTAAAGSPESRAVASSYSHSLLASAAVASQPHPDRKSVLVEANGIFLGDMMGIGMMLQLGLRQGYGLDRSNTVFTALRGSPAATVLETQAHFFTASVNLPSPGAPPGAPVPVLPRFLPDTRSLLVGLSYSLAPLPDVPMAPRRADPRLGLFTTTVLDFGDDLALSPRQRYVTRWRLEKKDPAAEMSEPVKPVTFWIDRNVPIAYRETVRAAVLEWNKAFEKIGIRGAIQAEQQPDDAKFDTLDVGYASVRWMMNANPMFAGIGRSHVDPRTGEILDADIAIEGLTTRSVRGLRSQVLAAPSVAGGRFAQPFEHLFEPPAERAAREGLPVQPQEHARCMHGQLAAEQLGYAMDVLEARGELEADSPLAQQFVQDYVKEVVLHEVGHALGLRHNFRASRAYTEAQLADAEFTRANGTTGSVMEYNAVNLPRPGQAGGVPFHTTLGPYDYWAVEYAYRPLPAGLKPAEERAELQRIAARSTEPLLAFGTDEDIFFGLDPETIQGDLGADPLAFAAKRMEIARDLFKRQETRELPPDRDYAVLRRSLAFAIGDVARSVAVLARQIGGVRTLRDYPGTGRDPLLPVPAGVQRQSLDLMSRTVFAADGLSLTPALQRRLAPDYLDRADSIGEPTDFLLSQRLLDLQRAVLNHLMSDGLAARVLDSATKVDRPGDAFQLAELYQRLADDVWSELARGGSAARDIRPERRDLQRSHVNRLVGALLRASPTVRADARGLMRLQARQLLARLEAVQAQRAGRRGSAEGDTSAHLADSIDSLRQALAAPLQRQGL
ncbi:MAG: zinc-dependent metalloprotease [Betaproteobacteria bacterium]|nr:zinc-dependent metalloprotease [Betaproteobacteria bacterium]